MPRRISKAELRSIVPGKVADKIVALQANPAPARRYKFICYLTETEAATIAKDYSLVLKRANKKAG